MKFTLPEPLQALPARLGLSNSGYKPLQDIDDLKANLYDHDDEDDEPTLRVPSKKQEKQQATAARKGTMLTASFIFCNVSATIVLTYLNKIVVGDEQFSHCQISFAAYHFSMTFLVLLIASLPPFNLFPRIRIPILSILPLCILFNGFLILGNLSLQYNEIAFYSLARLMTCPTVAFLNFVFFRTYIARGTLLAVVILTLGIMIANGKFGLANPLGASIATAAFTVTALYQILIGRRMKDLNVSPPQLLFNQAPVAALLLLAIVPVVDKTPDLTIVPAKVWVALIASGFVAALFNLTQFLIIGATSALTFNVMGIAKIVGNLTLGWTIAGRFPTIPELIGVAMSIFGTWLYAVSTAKKPAGGAGEQAAIVLPEDDVEMGGLAERELPSPDEFSDEVGEDEVVEDRKQ